MRTHRTALVALAAVLLLGSAPANAEMALPPPLSFLHVGPATGAGQLPSIVDSEGRQVLLRGVNINGLEDYFQASATPLAVPYPSDTAAYSHHHCPAPNRAVETMALCWFDPGQIRAFGYDSVRLALSWSLLEPEAGRISRPYLDRVAQVVGWFAQKRIRVILDLHQDAWSKFVYTTEGTTCPPAFTRVEGYHEADGAPGWATSHQLPACALAGVRELDAAVQANFQAFYADLPAPDGIGLQEHYAGVLAALARRFGENPTVAGYDLMNEPSPGFTPGASSAVVLLRLDAKLIAAMRTAVPGFRQLVVIEPEVTRDVTDEGAVALPWAAFSDYRNVVYGPHLYPGVFTLDSTLHDAAGTPRVLPVHNSYAQAIRDALVLGLPLWVGEFGTDVRDDATYLTQHFAEQDAADVGSSLWVWKEFARSSFSVEHEPFGKGIAYPSRIRVTDRAYPQALNGRLVSLTYDPTRATFHLQADQARRGAAPTIIHLPRQATGALSVRGATASLRLDSDGGRYVEVRPFNASYQLDLEG